MNTILTLVRHGETEANLTGLWQGATDGLLTARGQEQAARVADLLAQMNAGPAALYTSPLSRALDTAEVIGAALNLVPHTDPDLAEYNLGTWEGQTFVALRHTFRLWERTRQDPDFAPPGGESPRQVVTRIVAALRRIEAAHSGQRVVVVSHGGVLSLGLGLILENDPLTWTNYRMDNCAVSELVLGSHPRLLCFNQTTHLDGI